jgi:anti-sigma factor RsiW
MASFITCQEFVELATDYLEDALDPATRRRFEGHLALCPGCETYLAQLGETARMTGSLEEKHLSGPAGSTLMNAFREWKTAPLSGSPARPLQTGDFPAADPVPAAGPTRQPSTRGSWRASCPAVMADARPRV